jgi:hypothetical protein
MADKTTRFDSVRFWDLVSKRFIMPQVESVIKDPAMIPVPSDHVKFSGEEEEYIVVSRAFEYSWGICSVLVNIQPVPVSPEGASGHCP